MEEEAVEGVRNAEGGTEWGSGIPRELVDSVGDVAKRNETPWKAFHAGRRGAGVARALWRGTKAHERMKPATKVSGRRCGSESPVGGTET
jgi:hypothetical protein